MHSVKDKQQRDRRLAKISGLTDVYLKNLTGLRRYLASYFHNRDDIDDVLQDTYLKAVQANDRQEIKAPKAFLYKIAKNLALNEKGKAANRLSDSIEDIQDINVLANNISPDRQLDYNRQFAAFCNAVALLPPQCRQVFVFKKVYGLSNKEIAEKLGVMVGTVDKHLAKGLQMCRNYLHAAGYEPGE